MHVGFLPLTETEHHSKTLIDSSSRKRPTHRKDNDST